MMLFVSRQLSQAICLLFVVYCNALSFSQTYPNLLSPKEISTIGYWNLGEKVNYTVTKKSERIMGKRKPKQSEESYSFSLEIIDSTEKAYTFLMKYGSVSSQKGDPIFDQLAALKANMELKYTTNELGEFDSLVNSADLRIQLLNKLKTIQLEASSQTDSMKQVIYTTATKQLIDAFKEIENTEALFLADILFLHGYFGISMQLTKSYDVELLYPCLGDFVLTGTGSVTLNTISVNADECMFTVNEKPNPQELVSYVKWISGYFFMEEKKKPLVHNLKINLKTQNKMRMELSSGWMKKVTSVSTTTIKDLEKEYKQITTTEYLKSGA